MNIYAIDKLMTETRVLAAQYYKITGQTLPVTSELARFDAARLLNLTTPESPQTGVDLTNTEPLSEQLNSQYAIQIKGRVLFSQSRTSPRIGQINKEGPWNCVVLVLFDADYEPQEIYGCERASLEANLKTSPSHRQKRGALSVAKFKAIGQALWVRE